MQSLVVFKHSDREVQLSITDANGQRWITANQIGLALEHSNIHNLIKDLTKSGEMVRGKHWDKISLTRDSDGKKSPTTVLSLIGIIRLAMRANTAPAGFFRDWAEGPLADIMTTGYHVSEAAPEKIKAAVYREASIIAKSVQQICKTFGVNPILAKACAVEHVRRETGLDFKPLLLGMENNIEEVPVNVTLLGRLHPDKLSAQKMNARLLVAGFQEKSGGVWVATEKGKRHSFVRAIKGENNEHTGTQLLWKPSVLAAIEGELDKPQSEGLQ